MTWQSHIRVYNWIKSLIQKDACTPLFTAALLTTARTCVVVSQSCLTLRDPMDYKPPWTINQVPLSMGFSG